jgi:hypothetical protein
MADRHRDRVDKALFLPRVDWRRPRNNRRQMAMAITPEVELDTKS